MNQAQEVSVNATLAEIRREMVSHEATMTMLRAKLLQHAAYFESYTEMYCFIRKHTPTFGDFCKDMLDASPIFDAAQKKRESGGNDDTNR